jgi:hypothetical protein
MNHEFQRGWYFSPEGGGASTSSANGSSTNGSSATGNSAADGSGGGNKGDAGASNETFEAWVEKQPETVKKLYDTHITGLKNTVKATREERDGLSNQLKELLPKAEKGSELEKSLLDLQSKLNASDKRANFAEEATKPEIGCSNPKAAFALANAEDLFDKRGNPDWDAIKKMAPELFGKFLPDGNAGSGSQNSGTGTQSMDDLIRIKAGRNTV